MAFQNWQNNALPARLQPLYKLLHLQSPDVDAIHFRITPLTLKLPVLASLCSRLPFLGALARSPESPCPTLPLALSCPCLLCSAQDCLSSAPSPAAQNRLAPLCLSLSSCPCLLCSAQDCLSSAPSLTAQNHLASLCLSLSSCPHLLCPAQDCLSSAPSIALPHSAFRFLSSFPHLLCSAQDCLRTF